MPKTPIDYSNTIIYKLCCKDINITDVYVGHTTNFIKRKQGHKTCCNNDKSKQYNLYVYKIIRENGGFENWEMVMIEEFECNNKLEALAKERYWVETLKATLNRVIPSRTLKEYYETNKETILEKKKEYYEVNKETLNEKQKEYYEGNKETIKEKKKEYYEANKKTILEKYNTKFECECGGCYTHGNKVIHFKTKKHQEYLSNKINV